MPSDSPWSDRPPLSTFEGAPLPDLKTLRMALPLPPALVHLMNVGRWKHPGESTLARRVPFIRDPLVFLTSHEHMCRESGPLMDPNDVEDRRFSEYRGSRIPARELPWIDVEQTLFILCNRQPGDDVGIALDYRRDRAHPRVVGGNWHVHSSGLIYQEIAPSFEAFAALLEL